MRLWSFVADRRRFAERRDGNLVAEHAAALLAGDRARARSLRAQQGPELAALMGLAEELAEALHPFEVGFGVRDRIRRHLEDALVVDGVGRLVSVVRGHAREAMLGAAIVGTAAASIVPVALHYHRRRRPVELSEPLS